MTEKRFSDLALISMHYKESVPVDEICKAFVQAHPRQLFKHPYLKIVVHRSSISCNRNCVGDWEAYSAPPDPLAGWEGYPSHTLPCFNEYYLTTSPFLKSLICP